MDTLSKWWGQLTRNKQHVFECTVIIHDLTNMWVVQLAPCVCLIRRHLYNQTRGYRPFVSGLYYCKYKLLGKQLSMRGATEHRPVKDHTIAWNATVPLNLKVGGLEIHDMYGARPITHTHVHTC
jgi:hypothetical protein